MTVMTASIGVFEAKAQLSRLPRAVEQGERFTSDDNVAGFVGEGRL